MICYSATFLAYSGREKEAMKILRDHVQHAKKEPGVLMTRVYRSRTEPRRFFIYHELADEAALEAHLASQHYVEHILTYLYGLFEPESLVMDTYNSLTPSEAHTP
jgi:quinol monooxygenase YgiN